MARFLLAILFGAVVVLVALAGIFGSVGWITLAVFAVVLILLGVWDVAQRRHSVLRNYPVIGHLRYLLEKLRPELQQYFIERNFDGRPYDRDTRSIIYERAKGIHGEKAFGTELDLTEVGYEYLVHSTAPVEPVKDPFRVLVGGPVCTQPYELALLYV
ncbi:MAG: gltB 3 [Aeromicrobium sp.]|nr:gltB 3 [Aeromicrobium sp.]